MSILIVFISKFRNHECRLDTNLDGVLALGEGVPQLDGLVPGAGDDLPVVGGEGHGHHVLGMVLEPDEKRLNIYNY